MKIGEKNKLRTMNKVLEKGGTVSGNNICIMGVTKEKREKKKNTCKEIMVVNLTKLLKNSNLHVQEAQ